MGLSAWCAWKGRVDREAAAGRAERQRCRCLESEQSSDEAATKTREAGLVMSAAVGQPTGFVLELGSCEGEGRRGRRRVDLLIQPS